MSDSSLIQSFLDTETTGIGAGHRIVEIGVVQVIDREVTSERFHVYLNPERKVDEKAYAVHGLSDQFLADQRPFKEISEALITCIRDTELCIHNADFDVGFFRCRMDTVRCASTRKAIMSNHRHFSDGSKIIPRTKKQFRCIM